MVHKLRLAGALGLAGALAVGVVRPLAADDAPGGVSFVTANTAFADVLAQAKKDGKLVFIEFRSSSCPWCKRMTKDVYSQATVGSAMKGFVSVAYDTDRGEGKDLAKRFHVQGFPTLVVVDAAGAEVDRLEGFRTPEDFTKEIERIQRGEGTIPELRRRVAETPDDVQASLELGRRLTVSAPAEAVTLLEAVAAKTKGKDRALEADALISLARAARHANDDARAKAACTRVLAEFADTDFAPEAIQALIPADDPAALAFLAKVRKASNNAKVTAFADGVEAQIHLHAAALALRRRAEAASDDAQVLNEVAWTSFEHKVNLRAAVGWARRAVELSKRDPVMLDTLANLLYVTGRLDEALTLEQEAHDGADSESLKTEFGETLAKLKASAAFRKDHPSAWTLTGTDAEDDEGATSPD